MNKLHGDDDALPPPPRSSLGQPLTDRSGLETLSPSSSLPQSPTSPNRTNSRALPPPHATVERIPVLDSAPPSGNTWQLSSSPITSRHEETMGSGSLQFAPTMVTSLPPPPLPPRSSSYPKTNSYQHHPPLATVSDTSDPGTPVKSNRTSTIMSLSDVDAARIDLDMPVLPPPPNLNAPMIERSAAVHPTNVQDHQPVGESQEGIGRPESYDVEDGGDERAENQYAEEEDKAKPTDPTSEGGPPTPLPLTTFAIPLTLMTLARRQTQIPILIIATEAANAMAYKNQLTLTDLLQGLMQQDASSNQGGGANNNNNNNNATNLPPLRSLGKSFTWAWSDMAQRIRFVSPETIEPYSYSEAQDLLSEHAKLQDQDGNLEEELNLLEDQVDNLVLSTSTSYASSSWSSSSSGQLLLPPAPQPKPLVNVQRDQAVKDAFALTSPPNLPWLLRYRHALEESTKCLPYDLLSSCPPLILLVASTREDEDFNTPNTSESNDNSGKNPAGNRTPYDATMACLQELYTNLSYYVPPCFQNGLCDLQMVRKEVLVLHDNQDPTSASLPEVNLRRDLQQNFGPQATLLRINSLLPVTDETTDLWKQGGRCGQCLSANDMALLKRYISTTLVASCLLPAIERRIVELNTIVTDRKKGVKNVWKSLWRTSNATPTTHASEQEQDEVVPAHEHTPSSFVVKYRHDSIESQTRLLADTLFWCKDYESAWSMYRLIKDDFKTDRAMSYYGSVHEMIALCLYQMDPYTKARDIFSHMETALLGYTRASITEEEDLFLATHRSTTSSAGGGRSLVVPHATRLATRLCLVLSSSRPLTNGRHLEVADLLASASSQETALGAAVLLEQSSAHYYRAGMYRKYAFHMLMSGHMFRASGQDHHAFRCFTSALYIYHDYGKWDVLHHHLRSALAAQLYSLGRMALALQLFGQLIGTCEHNNVHEDDTDGPNNGGGARVSLKSQQKFVQRFLEICEEHPKKALVGADRMAVIVPPPTSAAETATLSASQRDALRQQRLERIVQVVRYTNGASRVLELPNVEMPCVDDSSVVVLTTSELLSNMNHQPLLRMASIGGVVHPTVGKTKFSGDAKVWEELEIATLAELRASAVVASSSSNGNGAALDDVTNRVLAEIESPETRRVIGEIDHEKTFRSVLAQRTKRSLPKNPVSRANMEPIWIEFIVRNPLGMDIELVDVQLVARLISAGDDENGSSGYVCTNEDAIRIQSKTPSKESWAFSSAPSQVFEAPEFGRSSPLGVEDESKRAWKSVHEDESPMFVVTKPSFVLEGGARVKVSLGLCPLVQGDLEVLGVRWKIFGQVWIYHPFHIQGPLLQNTAFNRANRVRGESMLLKSKIGLDMPCLVTELIPNEDDDTGMRMDSEEFPFLEGQVSFWKLRVTNVGTAPASRVFLKTNMPWVSVQDSVSKSLSPEDWEGCPTSCCVGPTGTLIELPLGSDKRLKEPNVVQSGEVAEIPIMLRTSGGGGKQFFYMLIRYQLWDPSALPGKEKCRWSRTMFEVPIYPSLTLTASIMPSYWMKNEHILSVEMTNYRTDRPTKLRVTLDSLSLVSRRYRMERLPGQLGDQTGPSAMQLGWQERVTVHYRIVPREEDSITCRLSQSPFEEIDGTDNSSSVDCADTKTTDFLCLENANDEFKTALKGHQVALSRAFANNDEEGQQPRTIAEIRRANTSMSLDEGPDGRPIPRILSKTPLVASSSTVHPTSLARLCPPEADASIINIVCSWSTTGGGAREARICGEHHLRQLSVRPRKKSKGCPITITAKHPTKVTHHFPGGSLRVPFEVTLRNRLVESVVDFEFCVEQPDCFELIGAERFKSLLEGGEELTIPLEALVQSAGVYNLQQVRLTVNTEDASVPYLFPLQWLVTVENA